MTISRAASDWIFYSSYFYLEWRPWWRPLAFIGYWGDSTTGWRNILQGSNRGDDPVEVGTTSCCRRPGGQLA